MSSKKSRRMAKPTKDYDHEKFVNLGASKKFTLILVNLSFIKEKGFHHPETIAKKGWKALCQPLRPAATMVMREFYPYLASHVVKKVRVRGVLVDFNAKSTNEFYNLESVNDEAYNRL